MRRNLLIILGILPLLIFAASPCRAEVPVEGLGIFIEDGEVILRWNAAPPSTGVVGYRIMRMSSQGTAVFYTTNNEYREPYAAEVVFYQVTCDFTGGIGVSDEVIIEDFESGSVNLASYPGEDLEPDRWEIDDETTFQNSLYSLCVFGNTWKVQNISPQAVQYNTMWGIAVNTYNSSSWWEEDGEIMAFGLGDGDNELFYTFRGSEMADSVHWRTTFHCVGEEDVWIFFYLPVGRDWWNAHGYEPTIIKLIYVNDEDDPDSNGGVYFDYICDITEDMSLPPTLTVDFEVLQTYEAPGMTVQFMAEGIDPDSDTLFYHWEFGDGQETDDQNPVHAYSQPGSYSAQATVHDETNLIDRASVELVLPLGIAYSEVVVNFTGDVMMARRYSQSGGIIPTMGANAIWEPSLDILGQAADLSFINLECVFTTNTSQPHPTKEYIFHGQPEYVDALIFAGIDGVSLGNNHIMDYMEPGLIETHATLDLTDIEHCGSGMEENEAMQPMVHYYNGVSIGNLGYCNRTGRADNLPPFMEAGPNKAGFTWFNQYYLEQTVPQAAELYNIVVAQVHCGIEYAIEPDTTTGGDNIGGEAYIPLPLETDSTTLDLQRMALDLGADLVLAHHPHVLQGYEVYDGKLIAHSLGNFAFDQNNYETFTSMILYVKLNREGIFQAWFRPVNIDDYIPNEATGELGTAIMHRIADYSRDMNAVVMPYYGDNIAYIALDEGQIGAFEESVVDTVTFLSVTEPPISYPMELINEGFISRIESLYGIQEDLEVQFGREMLWVGNFEDEGSTIWELDSEWETIDSQITLEGEGALRLWSNSLQSLQVQVSLENRFAIYKSEPYSIACHIKGINANSAKVVINYYISRYSGGAFNSEIPCGPLTGTEDWTFFCADLNIPPSANYGNILCINNPPIADEGYAWFDELKIIRWEEQWRPLPATVPYPNNYKFIRIRGGDAAEKKIGYTVVKYDKPFN